MTDKQEVIKHSAAIQIQNSITLLQRRAWNVLLANAYDDLPTKDTYEISLKELMRTLEYNSGERERIKAALRALRRYELEWNVLGKDGVEEWGVTGLLADAVIKGGMCEYSYSPILRKRLHNPRMYARISLIMQNKFESKHSLALWEICLDYLDESKRYGETPFIPLEQYRKLMGIAPEMYSQFKILNKWVIKDPIVEINRVTDFEVNVAYQRQNRIVVAVKFRARRVAKLPHLNMEDRVLFPDTEEIPAVVTLLETAGLSVHDAGEIWQQQWDYVSTSKRPRKNDLNTEDAFVQYIQEKIDLVHQSKPRNRMGFLISAIKENYANPDFAAREEKRQGKDRKKKRAYLQLVEERSRLQDEQDQANDRLCAKIINEHPALVDELVQEALAAGEIYRGTYDERTEALDNYHASEAIRNVVNLRLIQRFNDQFTMANTASVSRLKEIDDALGGEVAYE